MKVEVIPNRGPASMGAELDRSLQWATQVDIASAFVSSPALKHFRVALAKAKQKKRQLKIRLIFGLYQRFTSPQAMTEMLSLQRSYPSKFIAHIARNNRFHWKLYSFRKGRLRRLYVGSANLTSDGLTADGELTLKITAQSRDSAVKLIDAEFEEMWQEDALLLDRSLIKMYEKLSRPKQSFLTPQKDNLVSSLLHPPKKTVVKQPKSAPAKPRTVCADTMVSDETAEMLQDETNWYKKGWDSISFYTKREGESVRDAKVILLVFKLGRGDYELSFHRVRGYVQLETPDGKYHVAHSRIPYSWCRKYADIKEELIGVGLIQKEIWKDMKLSAPQLKTLCRLLRVKPQQQV